MTISVEVVLKTRAAIVAAPEHMFNANDGRAPYCDNSECGSPACWIGWAMHANGHSEWRASLDHWVQIPPKILGMSQELVNEIYTGAFSNRGPFRATRADAVAMCDLLIEKGEAATWREVIDTRPHTIEPYRRELPASIVDALGSREGPLRTDEPSDETFVSALEVGE